MNSIGIDFGTTNSVVAAHDGRDVDVLPIDDPPLDWAQLGFARVLPSVLAIGEAGEATFGWRAKTQASGKLEAVKRLFATDELVRIGDVEYSVELAAALLFARLKEGGEAAGAPIERAVVTIPANSLGLARYRTKLCAGLAGIDVAALINEPTAAAMAHSISARDDQNILVFDWGGGTLDVTVLETVAGVFIERASKGIQRSGGIDLDNLLGAALTPRIPGASSWDERDRGLFRLAVEQGKILLSAQDRTQLQLPDGSYLEVTRDELVRAIRPKIEETRGPIDQCLRDLRLEPRAIDQVVLVGGSSKIPAVREFVAEILGKEPAGGVDPMTAIAEGAAIAGAILAGDLDADFFVSTEHALGTISVDDYGVEGFSELIGRNHQLPAKAIGAYRPAVAGQTQVHVRVIEGDPRVPLDHPDNVILKEWDLEVEAGRDHADTGFTMLYEYDVDGILHVTVTDDLTGNVLLRDDVSFGISQDKAALVDLAKSVREMMRGGSLPGGNPVAGADGTGAGAVAIAADPVTREVLERVRTKILPFVEDAEAQRLEAMCRDLEQAAGDDAEGCRAELEREARKYAYLF
jgi:molecular chaperone DnaK